MIFRKTLFSLLAVVFLSALVPASAEAQEKPEAVSPVKPEAITHDVEGKESCLVCHALGATPVLDVPVDHEKRGNESCLWCHSTDSPMLTMQPSTVPHLKATAETDCGGCHGPEANPDVVEVPATHEGRGSETCFWCHVKVDGGGPKG